MTYNLFHWFQIHSLHVRYLLSYHCATRIYIFWCWISDVRQKFIPISDIMSDSALFSPISDIPIFGSVRRWSRISDWVPIYANYIHLSKGCQYSVGQLPEEIRKLLETSSRGLLHINIWSGNLEAIPLKK
jgi:hypothetical protein